MSAASSPATLRTERRLTLSAGWALTGAAISFTGLYLAAGALTPLLVVYKEHWNVPASLLTLAFAVYAVGFLAAVLTLGSLSDHVGRSGTPDVAAGAPTVDARPRPTAVPGKRGRVGGRRAPRSRELRAWSPRWSSRSRTRRHTSRIASRRRPPGIACSAGSAPRRSTLSAGRHATRAAVAHAVSVLRDALHGG